jgi:hypothetical protein
MGVGAQAPILSANNREPIMSKFKKDRVIVEAFQVPVDGEDLPDAMWQFLDVDEVDVTETIIRVPTPLGMLEAQPGEWLIKITEDEFSIIGRNEFAAQYEPIEE